MVELVDHEVGRRLCQWSLVGIPSLRVCLCHIYHGSTLAIHAHSLSKYSRSLLHSLLGGLYLEGIELTLQVALHVGSPRVCGGTFHLHRLYPVATSALIIDMYLHSLGFRGSNEAKCRSLLRVCHLVESLLTVALLIGSLLSISAEASCHKCHYQ